MNFKPADQIYPVRLFNPNNYLPGLITTSTLFFLLFAAPAMADAKRILGWLEMVTFEPYAMTIKAKLDTGALTSSLHAKNIEYFSKDDKDYVRFDLIVKGEDAETRHAIIERPVERLVKIKDHEDNARERPVVSLSVCLDNRRIDAEFTLADRSKFNYPVLMGRRFLKDFAVIDSAATYLAGTSCTDSGNGEDSEEIAFN